LHSSARVSQTANRIDKPDIQEAEGADIWVKSSSLQWGQA
jgi:hypothetical protein